MPLLARLDYDQLYHLTSPPTAPARCGIEQMVDQTEGLLLLIGILLLGILIGVASAVAVCLICPKIHRYFLYHF